MHFTRNGWFVLFLVGSLMYFLCAKAWAADEKVAIQSIQLVPAEPKVGEKVVFEVVLQNLSSLPVRLSSEIVRFYVEFQLDGRAIPVKASFRDLTLSPEGTVVTRSEPWRVNCSGDHVIRAVIKKDTFEKVFLKKEAKPAGTFYVTSGTRNVHFGGVTSSGFDLAITDLGVVSKPGSPGTAQVRVEVTNIGLEDVRGDAVRDVFEVTLRVDEREWGVQRSTQSLWGYRSRVVVFEWPLPAQPGEHEFEAEVHYLYSGTERNRQNNVFRRKIFFEERQAAETVPVEKPKVRGPSLLDRAQRKIQQLWDAAQVRYKQWVAKQQAKTEERRKRQLEVRQKQEAVRLEREEKRRQEVQWRQEEAKRLEEQKREEMSRKQEVIQKGQETQRKAEPLESVGSKPQVSSPKAGEMLRLEEELAVRHVMPLSEQTKETRKEMVAQPPEGPQLFRVYQGATEKEEKQNMSEK